MPELPDGTVTLLFTDIEASTALVKRLGDGWPAVLDRTRALLRGAVEERGMVVDCQGDAMFAVFRSANAGVAAAISAQTALAREHWPDGTTVRVRMALHTGEPTRAIGEGYTGIDVVRAARLCAAGHGGQVLLSEAARAVSRAEATDLGATSLPDMDEPEHVYQLVAPALAASFPPLRRTSGPVVERTGEEDFDARIENAAASLERRINERVATSLERLLGRADDDPPARDSG